MSAEAPGAVPDKAGIYFVKQRGSNCWRIAYVQGVAPFLRVVDVIMCDGRSSGDLFVETWGPRILDPDEAMDAYIAQGEGCGERPDVLMLVEQRR
jgi:hypothetical protein